MSQVPQDPRQLARDILSGKVKIEDLARMRQQRGGQPGAGGGGARPAQKPQARPPQQIPLARPPQQQAMPARRPVPVKQQQVVRPVVRQQGRGPQIAPPRAPVVVRPVTAPLAPMQTEYKQAQDSPAKGAAPAVRVSPVKELVKSKRALRQGILLAEVLGKPVALREEW